jgi:hypothetical protein
MLGFLRFERRAFGPAVYTAFASPTRGGSLSHAGLLQRGHCNGRLADRAYHSCRQRRHFNWSPILIRLS